MRITQCTPRDFQYILSHMPDYWENRDTLELHHAMFVREFQETAFVIRRHGQILGYLFGFIEPGGKYGYVHLIASHREHRGHGIARDLYDHFFHECRRRGCTQVRAITSAHNRLSIQFHRRLGFKLVGNTIKDGHPVMKNYAGPGKDRVLLMKNIAASGPPLRKAGSGS
ncbi:MAG: GNAT family N-acetyltransferase [Leptospiraceae bacterium]|nr:GNAT family N-acetyltransferase [Leptospiraceae bacterium]